MYNFLFVSLSLSYSLFYNQKLARQMAKNFSLLFNISFEHNIETQSSCSFFCSLEVHNQQVKFQVTLTTFFETINIQHKLIKWSLKCTEKRARKKLEATHCRFVACKVSTNESNNCKTKKCVLYSLVG